VRCKVSVGVHVEENDPKRNFVSSFQAIGGPFAGTAPNDPDSRPQAETAGDAASSESTMGTNEADTDLYDSAFPPDEESAPYV
jgi:hypothetical protein